MKGLVWEDKGNRKIKCSLLEIFMGKKENGINNVNKKKLMTLFLEMVINT